MIVVSDQFVTNMT